MERNCDALATMLWRKAYPNVDHEALINQVYDVSLARHLRNIPHLDDRETHFDPDYSYKRAETVNQLLQKGLKD